MGCRSTVFGREPWINTIIGGVAGSISSKSALATKLAISESIIKRFEIVGSDVHAMISNNYLINPSAFYGSTEITSYIDIDGYCISAGQQSFSNCSIVNAYLKNCLVGNLGFAGTTTLTNSNYGGEYIYLPATINGTSSHFRGTMFKKFNAPNLEIYPASFLRDNTELLEIVGRPTSLGSYALSNTSKLTIADLTLVTTLSENSLSGTALPYIYLDSLISITGGSCFRGTKAKEIVMPVLESMSDTAKGNLCNECAVLELFSAKKLKTFGVASSNSNVFRLIKTGCVIEINLALATSNAGAADAALVWAKANRAAIVKFYDDAGNYVSTL